MCGFELEKRPCKGRIPNFHGHNRAANRLSKCKEYIEARTVKINSSRAQEKVRYLSLWDRKVLHVPCPSIQVKNQPNLVGFLRLILGWFYVGN